MKLLILTQKVDSSDDNLGFFHRWIEEFAKQCESVIVICLYEGSHQLPSNVRVLSLGKENGVSRLKYLVRFYRYVWRERRNYDGVFVHMNQIYVILGGLMWRAMGKQIGLWYAHGTVSKSLRIATYIAHDVFTSTVQSFRINTDKRHLVGHGIDTDLFVPHNLRDTISPLRLVSIGRISPSKDHRTAVEAVSLMCNKGIDVSMSFVGSPGTAEQYAYLNDLVEMVSQRGLARCCHFVGAVAPTELPKQLVAADIFVHASHTGSLDKAALEAMAAGIPIITCNESVMETLPIDLRERFSFRKSDPHNLAEKICSVAAIPLTDRTQIGLRLRALVLTDYALPHLVSKILAFYRI